MATKLRFVLDDARHRLGLQLVFRLKDKSFSDWVPRDYEQVLRNPGFRHALESFTNTSYSISMVLRKRKAKKVVAVSGGFDPIHMGHIRYLNAAKKLGDELVVILNNDNWLNAKKGFVFMPEEERLELLKSVKSVDRVVLSSHQPKDPDRSVARDLEKLTPDVFANGGDRNKRDAEDPRSSLYKDAVMCKKYGIKIVYGVGAGGKVQSSSWLTNKIARSGIFDTRPWGHEEIFKQQKHFWIKILTISPGHRFSLQKHTGRTEAWVCIEGTLEAEIDGAKHDMTVGTTLIVPQGATHRLYSKKGGTVAEIAYGPNVTEKDIIRFEDDYGRV